MICDHHHLPTCRHLSGDWEQLHLAVLSGQRASGTYRFWANHKNWRNIKSMLSVLKWIWFRDWTELVFTLECKCAKEGGLGGSRMRELCAHCRISGTTLPSNVCVLMESSLPEDLNEEQDNYLLPAGQTKLFLLIFGFLVYFCLFEIFALLFFSSQILSLSVAIHYVWHQEYHTCDCSSPWEQPSFINWAVSLLLFWKEMNPETTFKVYFLTQPLISYQPQASCFAHPLLLEQGGQGCDHRASTTNSLEQAHLANSSSKLFVAFVNSSPFIRGSSCGSIPLSQDRTTLLCQCGGWRE